MSTLSIEIDPNHVNALYNLGNEYLKESKYKEALQYYERVEVLQPGKAQYSLGCLYAVQGEPELAREALETAENAGKLETRQHMEQDRDLDSLRDLPWFIELLERAS